MSWRILPVRIHWRFVWKCSKRSPIPQESSNWPQRRRAGERPSRKVQVEASLNRIRRNLQASGEREVPSRVVGEAVMNELRRLDHVAFVRFASVYRDFQDLEEFRAEIDRLSSGEPAPDGPAGSPVSE